MPITEANELLNLYENIEVDKAIIELQTISVPITALNTNQCVFNIQNTDQKVLSLKPPFLKQLQLKMTP